MNDWCSRCGRKRPWRTPLTDAMQKLIECQQRFRKTTHLGERRELRRWAEQARNNLMVAATAELDAMDAILDPLTGVKAPSTKQAHGRQTIPGTNRSEAAPIEVPQFVERPLAVEKTLADLAAGRRVHANTNVPDSGTTKEGAEGNRARWPSAPPAELLALAERLSR